MGGMGEMSKVAVHGKEGFKNAEKRIWRSKWRFKVKGVPSDMTAYRVPLAQ